MKHKSQSGRSMVEMLGTLAIIGVLSIGGIAGYSYGMDKYRANQTINDVMLMGVDMITQLSQNRGIPTLSEWGTKTTAGYDFRVIPNPENETQYGIQITGVPSSVCKMVGDGLKQTVAVYVGNEDYNSNTENDPCDESNSNAMEFYFEVNDCIDTSGCANNEICWLGKCQKTNTPLEVSKIIGNECTSSSECQIGYSGTNCSICSNGYCMINISKNGDECTLSNGETGQCLQGQCEKKECTYDTNKCPENYYCASPNTYKRVSNCQAFYENEVGVCTKADFQPYIINGKTYAISNFLLNWWDADAACKSIGYTGLISAQDLLINWDKASRDNNSILTFKLNEDAIALYNTALKNTGYPNVWLNELYSSCRAYDLNLSSGKVNGRDRYDYYYRDKSYAICK